jgi:hypothetical protein
MANLVFHRSTPPQSGPLRAREPGEPEDVRPVVVRCGAQDVPRELARPDSYDADQEMQRRGGSRCGACFAEGFHGWHELTDPQRSEIQRQCQAEKSVTDYAKNAWQMFRTGAGPHWERWQPEI